MEGREGREGRGDFIKIMKYFLRYLQKILFSISNFFLSSK